MKYSGDAHRGVVTISHDCKGSRAEAQKRVRRRVFGGFVVPLGLALLTSLVVFRIVSSYDRDFARVNQTSLTSSQLNALIKTVVEAGIVEFEAKEVLEVNARPDRFGCLAVGELLGELHDRYQS